MNDIDSPMDAAGTGGLLDRSRTIADARFNRWLVPPAALAIHLCIGMAYGFSVFWLPMSKLLTGAAACTGGVMAELTTTSCNWTVPGVTYIFEAFIVMLGISAAIWGGWLERVGPRKAGFVSALCWGGGLMIGGYGVSIHQLWLVLLGSGVIGGIGLGLGYITPVSTLIKWFPDRRGMATGFAIMGFGGGALIGSPLTVALMKRYADTGNSGVPMTMLTLGIVYLVVMTIGAFSFRVAPTGWKPEGYMPAEATTREMVSRHNVSLSVASRTPQFWLIWGVLCTNVTAGIAVLAMASPMFTDMFGGQLIHVAAGVKLSAAQTAAVAASAAGLVGLISLFNSLGRIFWASLSDRLGRKTIYFTFFSLGIILYCALPSFGHAGLTLLFVATICIIMSMYGGGFSTVPAYLSDMFGTQFVGAIHGRLLTAWSVAGIVGPNLIAGLRDWQLGQGVAKARVYDGTLYIMAGLLAVGFICNLLVKPVDPKHYMSDEEMTAARAAAHQDDAAGADTAARGAFGVAGVLAWAAVGIPFAIGLYIALQKAAALF
jgi:MFS family permease